MGSVPAEAEKGWAGWNVLSVFPFSALSAGLNPLQAEKSSSLNKYYKTLVSASWR